MAVLIGLVGSSGSAAIAAGEPEYYLPAPAGTALTVAQGNHTRDAATVGRSAEERYAFDFVAADRPLRFPVTAARGGTVLGLRSDAYGGACDEPLDGPRPKCWRNVNYVLIDHGDGTSGLYLHLRRGEISVRVGQVVSAGQEIGTAGTTGWTDAVGLQFQLQETPAWNEIGPRGWFLTSSLPVAFADPDVMAQRSDGVPRTGDTVTSSSPAPRRAPFRLRQRPTTLAAAVPLVAGESALVDGAYDADSPDGYGLHLAASDGGSPSDPVASDADIDASAIGTEVRPIFGGVLAYAGCGSGASASLGRMVAVRLEVDDASYLAVLGHLSDIDTDLLATDPELPAPIVGPNDVIGRYGAEGLISPAIDCPAADPEATDLYVGILRSASVTDEGEIVGGVPISPEPLVGATAYEGLDWWSGPLEAVTVADEAGRPRAIWNRKTVANAGHVPYGQPVRLTARVRDRVDIAEVRFRAWYPDWARPTPSGSLPSFDPDTSWRRLAVCTPPGADSQAGCRWNGSTTDALVTYRWDPTAVDSEPAPWLPRARTAMTRREQSCVPVSLSVEVVDTAGHVYAPTATLPLPPSCDTRSAERAQGSRLVYLDPLVIPDAPAARPGARQDRGWPPVNSPDPLNGAIVWRDRSDNEQGFRIFARRSWLQPDCSITDGPWQVVTDVGANKQRYRPRHRQVVESIEVPVIRNVPGSLTRWEYAVAAFNEAGMSRIVPVGGFVGGSEAFCDTGLEPPPDL